MRWALLLLCVPLLASEEQLDGTFHFGFDALYWKPTLGGFDYVEGDEHVTPLSPDSEWGVRIAGRYLDEMGCNYFAVSGLYFSAVDSGQRKGEELQVGFAEGIGDYTDVLARLDFDYWNVVAKVGHYLYWTDAIGFHLSAGFAYVDLIERQKIRALQEGPLDTFRQKLEFWGVGPQIGAGAMAHLLRCVEFFGDIGVVALIGEQRTHFITQQMEVPTDRRFNPNTVIVPGLLLNLGFGASLPWRSVWWTLAVGYELHQYFDVYRAIPTFSGAAARLPRSTGFAGPYLSVVAGF
jgi:Legionella pneumophila major outer membrane protein precursor